MSRTPCRQAPLCLEAAKLVRVSTHSQAMISLSLLHMTELARTLGLAASDTRRNRIGRPPRRWEDALADAWGTLGSIPPRGGILPHWPMRLGRSGCGYPLGLVFPCSLFSFLLGSRRFFRPANDELDVDWAREVKGARGGAAAHSVTRTKNRRHPRIFLRCVGRPGFSPGLRRRFPHRGAWLDTAAQPPPTTSCFPEATRVRPWNRRIESMLP